MLSCLDEGNLDVVPSSKVMTTKKHGHGENNVNPPNPTPRNKGI